MEIAPDQDQFVTVVYVYDENGVLLSAHGMGNFTVDDGFGNISNGAIDQTFEIINGQARLKTNVTTVDVAMKGQAVGYRSIALQSDLFAQNKQLIDPVFSNLTLDNKGNVLFDLQFSVDPTFIDYKKMLAENNLN